MDLETIGSTPWHERLATHSHHRRFEYLVELHRLTETWLRELQVERPAHSLNRGLGPEVAGNLWMLENPSERGVDALLDDTSAEDVLSRLERTIWAAQAYTLGQLLERTGAQERSVLDSILEQTSWKLGRAYAEKRWTQLTPENRQNLRRLLLAYADTPFGSYLVLRATEKEAQIELHHCPHQSVFSEVKRIANELCAIHHHWTRGFAYGLHHRLQVQQRLAQSPSQNLGGEQTQRCGQRWYFAHVL